MSKVFNSKPSGLNHPVNSFDEDEQAMEFVYTTSNGVPMPHAYEAQRIGQDGPLLLQDFHLVDLLSHFDRERIPERVVHAKGAGAHGVFKCTKSLEDICMADAFINEGLECPVTVRFSTVGGESGSADTARDPRGFAMKLKTRDGNMDWVFNNTPVFFLRDAAKFPTFIHTQKRDPQTHLKDVDMFWDWLSSNPESIHQVMILFGDRGVPDGYRFMHGYSGHTFKLDNGKGSFVYAQIHLQSEQGTKFLTQEKAVELGGKNPDYAGQDLLEAIEKGDFPSWGAYLQVMTPEEAEKFEYNILDLTKTWPHAQFPLRKFGKLTLNENVQNYHAEIEQIAFAPSHLLPGIEPSADPVLQSRLFSYSDTHLHRLGANHQQLPINAPIHPVANFQRDGPMAFYNQGSRPNYPSTIQPLTYKPRAYSTAAHEEYLGAAMAEMSEVTEKDFEQPRALWTRVFDEGARKRYVENVSGHLGGVKVQAIKERQVAIFAAVDQDLGDRVAKAIGVEPQKPLAVKSAAEALRFRPKRA